MTTKKQINLIIQKRYNGFKGIFKPHEAIHSAIRKAVGDKEYLLFLQKAEAENPCPVFQMPEQLKTGLKDKAGNEIYLGDTLLQAEWKYKVVVIVSENEFAGKLVCKKTHACANMPYSLGIKNGVTIGHIKVKGYGI